MRMGGAQRVSVTGVEDHACRSYEWLRLSERCKSGLGRDGVRTSSTWTSEGRRECAARASIRALSSLSSFTLSTKTF
jgi:hypothetical protein